MYRSYTEIDAQIKEEESGIVRRESRLEALTERGSVTASQQWIALHQSNLVTLQAERAALDAHVEILRTAITTALNAGDTHLAVALQREKAELA